MNFPGEALIVKLWETLAEKGVGGLLKPWQIKREGMAQLEVRRAELLVLAQAQRDADDIRAGRKDIVDSSVGALVSTATTKELGYIDASASHLESTDLRQLSSRRIISDSIRQEVNVAKAITHAETELRDDPQTPSADKIQEDWLFRWRDYAGEVSSEQLQSLWGKLLAGEVKSPGAYSLRTLEFLRNLSPTEAEDISKLSRFVVSDAIFRSQQLILDAEGISFGFLHKMQELGVASGVESISGFTITYYTADKTRFMHPFRSNGRVLIAIHDDPKKELSLAAYSLTEVGKQILRLGRFEPHEKYLRGVGEIIKGQGFAVSIASYIDISPSMMQLSNSEVL